MGRISRAHTEKLGGAGGVALTPCLLYEGWVSAGQWAQVLAQYAASTEELSSFHLLYSHQSAVMFKAIAILGCIHKWLAPCKTKRIVLSLFCRYSDQTTPLHLVQFTSDFQKVTEKLELWSEERVQGEEGP